MEKSYKILFLTFWYPTDENQSNGIFIKKIGDLIAENNELIVLHYKILKGKKIFKKSTKEFRNDDNVLIHEICIETRFKNYLYQLLPLHSWIIQRYVKKNIQNSFNFDIVHSNVLFPAAIIGNSIAKQNQKPHVISEHWSGLSRFFRKSIFAFIGKSTLNKADSIIAVSDFLKMHISQFTSNNRITVIPNYIDANDFYPISRKRKESMLRFIAVANWKAPKNPYLFLEALEVLAIEKAITDFELTLVGEGPQLMEIKKTRYSYPINFIGNQSSSQINGLFSEHDVFLHSSLFETFSVVIIEALYSGIPVVVSNVGVASEFINKENGIIVPEHEISDWTDSLKKLVNNLDYYNREKNGKTRFKSLQKEKIQLGFQKEYERLIEKPESIKK